MYMLVCNYGQLCAIMKAVYRRYTIPVSYESVVYVSHELT